MNNQEKIVDMFKKKYSAYNIHIELGIPIKQVYHHIAAAEKAYAVMSKKRHLKRVSNEL